MFEGELFYVARMKDTIVVRGRNHAAEDIVRAFPVSPHRGKKPAQLCLRMMMGASGRTVMD